MSGAWRWRLPLQVRASEAMPAWMEGAVNFLPYRRARALRLRRRRRIQLSLAACVGLLSALALGEAQRIHAARADARSGALNSTLSQMEPALSESAGLQRALQARLRRVALIDELAVKRDEAFHLLTALGDAPPTGIALTELHYRAGRASVSGGTSGQHALAAWVARLEQLAAFDSVEITDIQRRAPRAQLAATAAGVAAVDKAVDFSVQIRFDASQPRAASVATAPVQRRAIGPKIP
jgi:Tfp pilus assembly protein PilN